LRGEGGAERTTLPSLKMRPSKTKAASARKGGQRPGGDGLGKTKKGGGRGPMMGRTVEHSTSIRKKGKSSIMEKRVVISPTTNWGEDKKS